MIIGAGRSKPNEASTTFADVTGGFAISVRRFNCEEDLDLLAARVDRTGVLATDCTGPAGPGMTAMPALIGSP